MRNIEKWMINTIIRQRASNTDALLYDGINSTRDNTMVSTRIRYDGEKVTTVYLHGNMIASYYMGEWGFTLQGWNTPTTKSRINALALHFGRYGVRQSKGKLYSGDKEVNKFDWF